MSACEPEAGAHRASGNRTDLRSPARLHRAPKSEPRKRGFTPLIRDPFDPKNPVTRGETCEREHNDVSAG